MQSFIDTFKNYDDKQFRTEAVAGRVPHWTESLPCDVVIKNDCALQCGMFGCGRMDTVKASAPNGRWVMTCPEHKEFVTDPFLKLSNSVQLMRALAELSKFS